MHTISISITPNMRRYTSFDVVRRQQMKKKKKLKSIGISYELESRRGNVSPRADGAPK